MLSSPALALLLALAAPLAAAQEESLSWPQALSEAARANPELQAARQTHRQAVFSVYAAGSAFLPQASLGAALNRSGDYRTGGGLGVFGEASPGATGSLSASWNLFNGFRDLAGWVRARRQLEAADARLRSQEAALGSQLRQAFVSLLQAQEQVALSADIARRQKANVDLVDLKVRAGTDNKASLLGAQASLAQARYQLRSAERGRRGGALELARLLGRSGESPLQALGALEAPPVPAEPDLAGLAAELPAVQAARAELGAAEAALGQAGGAWLPSLNASASANRSSREWLGEQGSWSASLSLSWLLFNGGERDWAAASALAAAQASRESLRAARAQALAGLLLSWNGYAEALDQAQVAATVLAAAQARAEVSRAQYNQGLTSYNLWDQIEQSLISAQNSALAGRGAALRAEASWQRDLGRSPWR